MLNVKYEIISFSVWVNVKFIQLYFTNAAPGSESHVKHIHTHTHSGSISLSMIVSIRFVVIRTG